MKALTRKELYLQAIATGNTENLPTPQTREEAYLMEVAKGGGGGGATPSTASVIIDEVYDESEDIVVCSYRNGITYNDVKEMIAENGVVTFFVVKGSGTYIATSYKVDTTKISIYCVATQSLAEDFWMSKYYLHEDGTIEKDIPA